MSALSILAGRWTAYDHRKLSSRQDSNVFCPDEPWEFSYLVEAILEAKPHLDHMTVMLAIRQAMRETIAPRPRRRFVEAVMDSIRQREQHWAEIIESAEQKTEPSHKP